MCLLLVLFFFFLRTDFRRLQTAGFSSVDTLLTLLTLGFIYYATAIYAMLIWQRAIMFRLEQATQGMARISPGG